MNQKLILKLKIVSKKKYFFDLYPLSLDKLLTQQSDWFIKRLEYMQKGDWINATVIETKYLDPLERKIYKLAQIAKMEEAHDDR